YIQRVGRAGRSNKVFRVALGILVLTNSPSQVRFVLGNEYLRLIDPEQIDPYVEIPVAWENEEIMRQHIIFSMLDVLAAKGNRTYLDYVTEIRGYWSDVKDAIDSIRELLAQLRREIGILENYVANIAGSPESIRVLESIIDRIDKKIERSAAHLGGLNARNVDEGLNRLRNAESFVTEAVRKIRDIRSNIRKILSTLRIKELKEYDDKLSEVENSLHRVLTELERLMR
ncbi:MAG: hypothetical protein ACTSPB_20850, partial [Candidatus Thorarchaeota archaeon]